MFGGGSNLEDLLPADFDGNRDLGVPHPDSSIGCHTGDTAGLNIYGLRPGFIPYWANDNPRSTLRMQQRGAVLVQAGDPEHAAYAHLAGMERQSELDSSFAGYPGVKLWLVPEDRERQRQDEIARKRLANRGASEADYASRSTPGEADYASRRGLRSLRAATHGHGYRATAGPNESDTTLETWGPGSGILRED